MLLACVELVVIMWSVSAKGTCKRTECALQLCMRTLKLLVVHISRALLCYVKKYVNMYIME